jgi:hypothetical protein
MAKCLYMILAHSHLLQLQRLVSVLKRGSANAQVAIHFDCSKTRFDQSMFQKDVGVYFVGPRAIPIEWGGYSHVEALHHCFQWALDYVDFDWFILLSGQDFPICPIKDIEQFYENTNFDGFIEATPLEEFSSEERRDIFTRYWFQYWRLPKNWYYYRVPSKVRDWLNWSRSTVNSAQSLIQIRWMPRGLGMRLGIRAWSVPFHGGFRCFKGSDWFSLSRPLVEFLKRTIQERSHLVVHYSRTILPSESFFHTVLWNASGLYLCNDNLRYISWPNHWSSHPATLTGSHFDALVSSGKHFARKFDVNLDPHIVDRLEAHVLGSR